MIDAKDSSHGILGMETLAPLLALHEYSHAQQNDDDQAEPKYHLDRACAQLDSR